jgi:hypothetical protein
VQVRYDEGVAIPIGPEPCVVVREGGGEASAGERIGQPSSRERKTGPGRRRRSHGGRQHGRARDASARPARRGQDPGMCGRSLCGNREISSVAVDGTRRSASGRRGAEADDGRRREVRLRHSSDEADEQRRATGCGAGGAKGGDRGECGPATHAPGAGPGKRVPGAGAHTASRKAQTEGTVHRALPPYQP